MHAIVMKFIATCTYIRIVTKRSPENNLFCVKRYQLQTIVD